MRDDQAAKVQLLVVDQQDVDVDHARSPAPCPHAPAGALDLLSDLQELAWRARPLPLDHLVEESRLVFEAPGFGLDDAASTPDANPLLPQAPPGRAQVAHPPAAVGAEA